MRLRKFRYGLAASALALGMLVGPAAPAVAGPNCSAGNHSHSHGIFYWFYTYRGMHVEVHSGIVYSYQDYDTAHTFPGTGNVKGPRMSVQCARL
jgi:hypothetical protein